MEDKKENGRQKETGETREGRKVLKVKWRKEEEQAEGRRCDRVQIVSLM